MPRTPLLLCIIYFCPAMWSNAHSSPKVVTDLPVIHSLVSMVMGSTGTPELLMNGKTSPHSYSLRPSDISTIAAADLLVWTSRDLTPWLARSLSSARTPIVNTELMQQPKTLRLAFRDHNIFEHNHSAEHQTHEEDSEHEHTAIDPHGWLDPVNAIYWLDLISAQLAEIDPDNSSLYQRNATSAISLLSQIELDISQQLDAVKDRPFVVFHDSYHYFENRFNVHALGAISLSDAEAPSIRNMNKLRSQVKASAQTCVFTEPQFDDALVTSLARRLDVTIGTLDPLGTTLKPGPELYPQLIKALANSLYQCLSNNLH